MTQRSIAAALAVLISVAACGRECEVVCPAVAIPAVRLRVTDVQGGPLDNVGVVAVGGEVSSCGPLGTDREWGCSIFGAAGTYVITVTAPGHAPAELSVTVRATPRNECSCDPGYETVSRDVVLQRLPQ